MVLERDPVALQLEEIRRATEINAERQGLRLRVANEVQTRCTMSPLVYRMRCFVEQKVKSRCNRRSVVSGMSPFRCKRYDACTTARPQALRDGNVDD
jgi:hypothetical protein